MRDRHWMRFIAVVVLLVASSLRADCVSTTKPLSSPGTFPNRYPGPVAWTGSFLGLVKVESDQTTNALYFATYDADLNQLTDDRKVADATLKGPATLIWTGSEFALFYQTPSRLLALQRIAVTGNPIGAPILIVNHPWSSEDEFDVTWVPARNAFALVHTVLQTQPSERGLWLSLLSSTGVVQFDTNISSFVDPPVLPRVVGLTDGTLAVLWSRSGAPRLMVLTVLSPSNTILNVGITQRNVVDVRMATNGTTLMIIFSAVTPTGSELRVARADSAANILTSDSAFLTGSGVDIAPVSLTWNPVLSEWALVYTDAALGLVQFPGDTRLRRFTSLTAPASDSFFSPNPLQSRLAAPYPVVFANGGYIGSIFRVLSSSEGSESYLVRSCPFIVTASADHPVWRPFAPVTFTATPSGGRPGYTYEWDFGDLSRGTGAVAQHLYQRPGTYTVTLTGTDAAGAQAVSTLTVQVAFLRQRAVKK